MDNLTMRTLSYASGPSGAPLLGETIGANLRRTAGRFAEHDAVVSVQQEQRLGYAELDALVDRVGTGLMRAGVLLSVAGVKRPEQLARVNAALRRWDRWTRQTALAVASVLTLAFATGAVRWGS